MKRSRCRSAHRFAHDSRDSSVISVPRTSADGEGSGAQSLSEEAELSASPPLNHRTRVFARAALLFRAEHTEIVETRRLSTPNLTHHCAGATYIRRHRCALCHQADHTTNDIRARGNAPGVTSLPVVTGIARTTCAFAAGKQFRASRWGQCRQDGDGERRRPRGGRQRGKPWPGNAATGLRP
jgi:hypothetical protein